MLSAPQIYHSGLVFAPQDSLVPQLYSSLFHSLITVSGDVDIMWPSSEALVIHEKSSVRAVAFSPDGTHILAGCGAEIRMWDAVTGHQVGEALRGHKSVVKSVAFSPDGTHIVSGSYDKTIRVWNVVTGHWQQVGEALRGHEHSPGLLHSFAFSPDGKLIVSGSKDKTIRVWDAVIGVNTPQYYGDWFRFGKKKTQSYILWIPHSLRNRDFILHQYSSRLITMGPKIAVHFENAALGPDWAKIKN